MLRLGPEDPKAAKFLAGGVQKISRFDLPAAFDRTNLAEKARLLVRLPGVFPIYKKWMKRPLSEVVARIRGAKLREGLTDLSGRRTSPSSPAGVLLVMLGFMAKKSNGYPIGGSAAFAEAIEKKYLELGGKIRYGFKVDKIIVDNGKAVGIKGGGQEVRGDIVISAADAYDTVNRMLGGKYVSPDLAEAFKSFKRYPSMIFVSLGLSKDYSSIPTARFCPEGIPGSRERRAQARPDGHPFLFVRSHDGSCGEDRGYRDDRNRKRRLLDRTEGGKSCGYTAEKKTTAEKVIAVLDRVFPGLKEAVESSTSRLRPRLSDIPITGTAATRAGCRMSALSARRWQRLFPVWRISIWSDNG